MQRAEPPDLPDVPALPDLLAQQAPGYLAEVLRDLAQLIQPPARAVNTLGPLDQVRGLLSGRRFTHLSRTQALPYLARMRPLLQADMDAGRPLRFCYDLGPGDHASVAGDFSGLRFAPGLAELLALRQMHAFGQEVNRVHAPGVRFSLVIDDWCGWLTNDVAPGRAAAYVERLVALVAAAGLQAWVDVLAEPGFQVFCRRRRAAAMWQIGLAADRESPATARSGDAPQPFEVPADHTGPTAPATRLAAATRGGLRCGVARAGTHPR